MGNKEGKPKNSSDITKTIKKPSKNKEIRCVVLGIAASGKTTFVRQLRVIHGAVFTQTELHNIKNIIRSNIVIGLYETAQVAARRNLELEEINIKYVRLLESLTTIINSGEIWKEDTFIPKLQSLWSDPAIQTAWQTSDKTLYNLEYFMGKIESISTDIYIPNNDDIFRARQRTSGAAATDFKVDKQLWNFKDAGGQPFERKSWPDIIDTGVDAIMFFVSLDEYDFSSDIDPTRTKMEESLAAWKDLFGLPAVRTSCVLLFLNKVDIFTQKWTEDRTSFDKIFEKGKQATTVTEAIRVVGDYYNASIDDEFRVPGKIYMSPITALDTSLVTNVFNQVKIHIRSRHK